VSTGAARELVVVTGISGSGKSVAMHALEDAGYVCIDNLPPELLRPLVDLEHQRGRQRLAVAVDVRSAASLPTLAPTLAALRAEGLVVTPVFLDSDTATLMRRFSETRRPHPLSEAAPDDGSGGGRRALVDAIELERVLLADLRETSTVVDTSQLRPAQLRGWMRNLVAARGTGVTLAFESFAFKHGVPLDADYVFDVRVLPNPFYQPELRPLTGRDAPVAAFIEAQPEAMEMLGQIEAFLSRWLPRFSDGERSYLTVAIGCTGGQHRSVWFAEELARRFAGRTAALVRHRELDRSS
jgi:UPF0042 nucleotide-binding protein